VVAVAPKSVLKQGNAAYRAMVGGYFRLCRLHKWMIAIINNPSCISSDHSTTAITPIQGNNLAAVMLAMVC